jgi:CheY-like chemotaxis protein
MPSTLVVLCGPPLPGRWRFARTIEQRLGARRLAECTAMHAAVVARELASEVTLLADGDLATPRERRALLAGAIAGHGRANQRPAADEQLLVEWRCGPDLAERECFHRYASRPEVLAHGEWERYRHDAVRRVPVDDDELPGRVVRIGAGLPDASAVAHLLRILPPSRTPPPQPLPRRVLVVEDDANERALLADVLRELGYAVDLAPDAGGALALLEDGAHVDVVVSDQCMPGMTGVELTRVLRHRHPEIACVLLTAYGDERTCHEAVAATAVTVLAKPMRVVDLARVLDEATARSCPPAP